MLFINLIEARISRILTLRGPESQKYHVSHVLIYPLLIRLLYSFYINLLMPRISRISCNKPLRASLSYFSNVNLLMPRLSNFC